jgi:prevent-host-death family protein
MQTVGADEAKTHLPALLNRVATGEEITITRHGVPVAKLVPAPPASKLAPPARKRTVKEAIQAMLEFRKGQRLNGLSIREMIEEGRR